MITHHRPVHRHWLEQTERREVEAGGGQSRSVSGSVQKAWTGTAGLEARPVKGKKAYIIQWIHLWYMLGVKELRSSPQLRQKLIGTEQNSVFLCYTFNIIDANTTSFQNTLQSQYALSC